MRNLEKNSRPGRRRVRGFTLEELLISIAVICLLAAMLFPVGMRARETARRAMCLSNLRQIGMAFQMYLSDWDGGFPNTNDPYLWMGRKWRWPLESYWGEAVTRDPQYPQDELRSTRTPNILHCPSDDTADQKYDHTSYGYSVAFYHTPGQLAAMRTEDLWRDDRFPCMTQRMAWVQYPSKKVLVAEWLTNHDTHESVGWWSWKGARNYLFVDGHAQYLPARQLNPAVTNYPDPNLTVGGIEGKDVP